MPKLAPGRAEFFEYERTGSPGTGRRRPMEGLSVGEGKSEARERKPGASVEERVIDIVCENLAVNKEQVKRETAFIEDIGADSLDIVELVMGLEEEFGINIPDDQAEKIKTVGEAIDYIEREKAKQ